MSRRDGVSGSGERKAGQEDSALHVNGGVTDTTYVKGKRDAAASALERSPVSPNTDDPLPLMCAMRQPASLKVCCVSPTFGCAGNTIGSKSLLKTSARASI